MRLLGSRARVREVVVAFALAAGALVFHSFPVPPSQGLQTRINSNRLDPNGKGLHSEMDEKKKGIPPGTTWYHLVYVSELEKFAVDSL